MDVAIALERLPKVELHCHVEGTMRPATVVELADKNGIELPTRDLDVLYRYTSLDTFLDVFWLVQSTLADRDDWARLAYESVVDGAAHGLAYRETFFTPARHLAAGQDLAEIIAGLDEGLAQAERETGVRVMLICAMDRAYGPEAGLDYSEAFALAGREGLRRTSHQGEVTSAANIAYGVDVLGCERIDHGLRIVDDPELMKRFADQRIPLTVCPTSNIVIANAYQRLADHPLPQLRDAGIVATVNTDDPALTDLDLGKEYRSVMEAFGYGWDDMVAIALDGVEATWLDDGDKAALAARVRSEAADLSAQLG
jgi:adenosine deaminase